MTLCQVEELEVRGARTSCAHGMHLDPAVYGQLQSLRWVANPPPAAEDTVVVDVAYGVPSRNVRTLQCRCNVMSSRAVASSVLCSKVKHP